MASSAKKQLAVLISGTGSNLQALIDQQADHDYEIVLVLSNRPNVLGLDRANKANIPHVTLDHTLFENRAAFDQAMMNEIDQYQVDGIILAGFMRILTPEFTEHYLGKMLNIHPSLLPKYPGLNTHQRALEAGDAEHGLSIHFVTAELDGGPVVLQAKVAIESGETEDSLKQKVQKLEHQAYPLVTHWLAQGIITLKNNQAYYQDEIISEPKQL